MNVIQTTFEAFHGPFILGHALEHMAGALEVDCSGVLGTYTDGTVSMVHELQDGYAYPVSVTMNGTVARWDIQISDLPRACTGSVQVIITCPDGTVIRSDTAGTIILPSVSNSGEEPPAAVEEWLQEAYDVLAEFKSSGTVDTDAIAAQLSGEIAKEVSKQIPDVPTALPNPAALTFAGAVSAEYDGKSPVTVNIPESGGGTGDVPPFGDWLAGYDIKLIGHQVFEANAEVPTSIEYTQDEDGNPFEVDGIMFYTNMTSNISYTSYLVNFGNKNTTYNEFLYTSGDGRGTLNVLLYGRASDGRRTFITNSDGKMQFGIELIRGNQQYLPDATFFPPARFSQMYDAGGIRRFKYCTIGSLKKTTDVQYIYVWGLVKKNA